MKDFSVCMVVAFTANIDMIDSGAGFGYESAKIKLGFYRLIGYMLYGKGRFSYDRLRETLVGITIVSRVLVVLAHSEENKIAWVNATNGDIHLFQIN